MVLNLSRISRRVCEYLYVCAAPAASHGILHAPDATCVAVACQARTKPGVIVYLTQGARHSSYGQSTVEQLRKSVALLYEHYNAKQQDSVLFLHTGDVDTSMQQRVLELCGEEASFFEIDKQHFRLPSGVDPTSKEWLFPKKFSEGYPHMIRLLHRVPLGGGCPDGLSVRDAAGR